MKLFETPVDEIIKKRSSVRTYSDQPISDELKSKIIAYMHQLTNPFGPEVHFTFLEPVVAPNSAKLGTYGVINGAKAYFGAEVQDGEYALEAVGYEMEHLILFLTSLGLGTCWLGGTFNRNEFAKAMSVREGTLFPAISPIGYAAEKKSMKDSLFRLMSKGDTREPWSELFFNQNFSSPLSPDEAGIYESPLEMVRLAPSASNKQPWRIVRQNNLYHFFEYKTPGYSWNFDYDIQRIDLGIAACHFHLAAMEKELKGEFRISGSPFQEVPANILYAFTWVSE